MTKQSTPLQLGLR